MAILNPENATANLITTGQAAAAFEPPCSTENVRRLVRIGRLPVAAIVGRGQMLFQRADVLRQIDRKEGVIRLEPGTTKNREGRTFTYGEIVEVKAAVDALWARYEALEQRGIIPDYVEPSKTDIISAYTRVPNSDSSHE